MVLVDLADRIFQLRVRIRVVEIAADVVDAPDEPIPKTVVDGAAGKLLEVLGHFLARVVVDMGLRPRPTMANSRESRRWLARL